MDNTNHQEKSPPQASLNPTVLSSRDTQEKQTTEVDNGWGWWWHHFEGYVPREQS